MQMQRIATLSAFLLLFGWATSRPSPVAAQGQDQCQNAACRFDYTVRQVQDWGSSGREARRCTGTWAIGVILPGSYERSCVEAQAEIDCAGNVRVTRHFAEGPDFCPTANQA